MISWISRYGRLLFIFVWMGLLFLIATNIQAGWLYVVISFLGLLCIFSFIIPKIAVRTVNVILELPDLCERGTPAHGSCTIENNSRFPRYLIRVDFKETPGLEFSPPGILVVRAGGGGKVSFSVKFTPDRRGIIGINEVIVSCGAPAGIFSSRKKIRVNAETLVHPRISSEEGAALAETSADSRGGNREKFYALEDPYHYKLREYIPGDSLCRIHWKLTAKRGKPIVRIHERKIFGHSGILIDNTREHYAAGDEERFEAILERAISLAYYLVFARGSSITISGSAAPEISVDGTESWEYALKWFAMIRLESVQGSVSTEGRMPGETDFLFLPDKEDEEEEAVFE